MAKKLSFKYGAEHERGRLYYVQDASIKIPLVEGQVLFAYKQFDTNKYYPYKAFINDLVIPQGDIRIYMDTDANARVPISTYFSDYSSQLWDLTNAEAVMEGDTDEPVYFNNGVPVQCSGVVVTSEAQTFNGNKTFTGTISTPKIEMPSTGGSGKTSIYFVNSANARTLYIRDYNTTAAYIVTTSGTSSVGSGTKPVYVNGSGVIKPSSSTKGSTSLPMYLNSGTFSACVPQDMFSAMSWTDGTNNGPTLNLTMFGYTRSDLIPFATDSVSGVVTTGTQTFSGNKTFKGKTVFNPSPSILDYVFDGAAQEDALCIRNENTNSGTTTISELYLDSAGIQSVSQGQASSLFLNCDGGSVYLGPNLFIDNNLIQSIKQYNEEEARDLYINSNGGKIYTNQININPKETPNLSYTDATTQDFLTIGNLSENYYMALDRKYIQAIYDNKPNTIYINPDGGDIYLTGEQVHIYEDGIVEISNNTASSSSTKGALIVSGGIGVSKTSYMSSILPKVTGDCALGGENNIWADIYSGRYYLTDSVNKYAGGMIYCTSSTSTSSQPTCVTLGNATATGTAGSRYGELRLFSQGTKYSRIITEDNSSSNRTVTIPALDGNMTLSETTAANDGVEQRIAFYTTNYKRLGSTTGFTVIAQNGDNIDNGRVKLYLGNSTPSGTMGNQFGELTLYGTTDKAIAIAAEPGLSENQRIYLRKYWASANTDAYLVATLGTQAVGDTDEPVYINSNGVATKCSGVVVTTGTQTFSGTKAFSSITFTAGGYSHGSIMTSTSTSTTSQSATLALGNSTATGTAGSRFGTLQLYNNKGKYAYLRYSNDGTTNAIINYLPPVAGTLMNGNYMVGVSGKTYGTVTQMNALSSPSTGQMFFVLV